MNNQHVVIEKDLGAALPSQALMDLIRGEIQRAYSEGASVADIVIRRSGVREFPNIIVDHNGELLKTMVKAVQLINTPESQEIQSALNLQSLIRRLGNLAQVELLINTLEVASLEGISILKLLGCDEVSRLRGKVLATVIDWRNCVPDDSGRLLAQLTLDIDAVIAAEEKAESAE